MPRLFVALPVPEPVRQALALARGGLEGARWVEPENYHVTLRFIGEVDDGAADRVAAALETVHAAPFTARISGYDAFGGDRVRSVHAALDVTEDLAALAAACEGACRAAGLPPETRKFSPHITLARLGGKKSSAVANWFSGRAYAGPPSFRVERFGLYTARPGGGGPYHEAVAYPLADEP